MRERCGSNRELGVRVCGSESRREKVCGSEIVGHPSLKKNSVGIFEYILASMLKVYFDVF